MSPPPHAASEATEQLNIIKNNRCCRLATSVFVFRFCSRSPANNQPQLARAPDPTLCSGSSPDAIAVVQSHLATALTNQFLHATQLQWLRNNRAARRILRSTLWLLFVLLASGARKLPDSKVRQRVSTILSALDTLSRSTLQVQLVLMFRVH